MAGKNIKFLEKSPVKLNFTQKLMTPYGGFALVAKLFEKLELKEHLEQIFPVVESSPNGTGIYAKVLRFGLTVLAGGKRFSHGLFLAGSEPVQAALFGVKRLPSSSSALTRFFRGISSWQKSVALAEGLWQYQFERVIPWQKVGEDYLSFDTTVVVRYGQQEGARKGPNPKKKGRPSHHPILAVLAEANFVLHSWLRSGNSGASRGVVEFLKEAMALLGSKHGLRLVRADSGFLDNRLLSYLEGEKVHYIVVARMTKLVKQELARVSLWRDLDSFYSVGEFKAKLLGWDRQRRFAVIRERKREEKGSLGRSLFDIPDYTFRVFVSSLEASPEEIWREYNQRATIENRIAELKYDLAADDFCMHKFFATEAAFRGVTFLYNLLTEFQRAVGFGRYQRAATLRSAIFLCGAILGTAGRRTLLFLSESWGGLKSRTPLFDKLLTYAFPTSPKLVGEAIT